MLSIPHLIIIFAVALIVFGPEKLPELARNLGKVMAEFRRATGDLKSTFEDHLRDLERETDEHRIASSSNKRATTGTPAVTAPQPQHPQLPTVPSASPTLRPKPDLPGSSAEQDGPDGQSEPAAKKSEQESETLTDGHQPA